MTTDPEFVTELRAIFKSGATPSSVVRRIAERYADEPELDLKVRLYFRRAFGVPVARVGPEMVETIRNGGAVPSLNTSLLHLMIELRPEWDTDPADGGWLDGLTATPPSLQPAEMDLQTLPELAGSWDRLDETAKRCVRRTFANRRTAYEQVQALSVLAESLQLQLHVATASADLAPAFARASG